MHNLDRRVNKLEAGDPKQSKPWIQIIVHEGEDEDAIAAAAGYDAEEHNLIVQRIVAPGAGTCID